MPRLRRLAALATAVALAGGSVFVSGSAHAKAPCYTQAEFEAEQAIRLHTELMVVGLTCGEMSQAGGPSLFAQYKQFTLQHRNDIVSWEKALIGHFKRSRGGNATREFDSFRTRLANETSQRAIALSNPVFCQAYVPAVVKALAMSRQDLMESLKADRPMRLAAVPRCDAPAKPSAARVAAAGGGRPEAIQVAASGAVPSAVTTR
ncbi:hypothetical protein [Rhodospirillum centenum]|uniref:Uncharacterized protein n=1 Tax=Rhodospirillum centenum (strain ATCC 51521 / SW) TaxID=414684 RepID=B6IS32_RHOCS|nr:hypothetical protein [Rhodospirillum centenum]ACI98268.1 hypothetical protein RC1_0838 [Rhodospirillum centenum SW]